MEFPTLYTEMTTPSLNSAQFDPHFLKFKVIKCSSFSSAYDPSNILVDCPADQASRWSSESNSPPQYLVLELENSSVLHKIIFGKYEKTHVCNLKKFKIYAGPTEESMAEVLESGLRNDHQKETFRLKNTIDSHYLPVKFVKIVPLQSWGNSFNFSIWYVELHGVDSKDMMEPITQQYDKYREHQAIRLCLKHLRQHNYMEAFEALQKKTKVTLEDPLLDRIHNTLVQNGDYDTVEEIVIGAAKDGLFNHYVNQQDFYARWSRIEPLNRDGSDQRPGQRGGHQMVIDPITETLYLYGGWDGKNELADFWSYHIPTQLWSCISSNTEEDGGPSARSCHKMIIDYERRHLFVLGCYLDAATRSASAAALKSGFYVYDIDQSKWIVITEDTYSMGGPRLLFDHQMCIDMEFQTIYVFGGKVQGCDERSDSHSGLYAYHIPTNHWRKLRGPDDDRNMRSRFGHSMQFNHKTRQLFVYAGQRGKEYINDFFSYDVDTDTVTVLAESNTRCETDTGPPAGFTQRATIDVELGTIHILLGLNRSQKADKDNQCRNVLWLYEIPSKQWSCLSNNPSTASNDTDTADVNSEPSPRYAHQLVYDHIKKIHYMFGGNPGSAQNRSLRLDDFWSLTLCRPSKDYVIRRCKYLMRKHRFKELAGEDAVRALRYLQKDLYETIDHDNKKETAEFQKLTISLFSIDEEITDKGAEDNPRHHKSRSELYSKLVEYFPSSMTQPTENLIDMIPIK